MFRKKRHADQQAWEAWQWIAQQHPRNRPLSESSWRHPLELVGQVTDVYMLAPDGTKAIVDFVGMTPPGGSSSLTSSGST